MQRNACVIAGLPCNRIVHSAGGPRLSVSPVGRLFGPGEAGLSGWWAVGACPQAAQEADKRIFLPQMAAFST